MDGFEFVAQVRKHDEWRSIPIVVLTAHDLSSEERLRLNGFVETILPKDEGDSREVLLHQVRDLLADCTRHRQGAGTEPKGEEKCDGVRLNAPASCRMLFTMPCPRFSWSKTTR